MIAQIATTQPVPHFERNYFLKEEATSQELASMHNLGFIKMTEQDLMEAKTAINLIGYNPITKLLNLMTENKVLAFARTGRNHHPHLNFLAMLLPKLKKEAGATHLALALPSCLQKLLDVFLITGEIFPNFSPVNLADYGLDKENDFIGLLRAARLAGYQLVAVEPNSPVLAFDPHREQIIAKHILTILDKYINAKVIFVAPDRHLNYSSIGDWTPAAAILKEKGIAIQTINQFWHSDYMPKTFACLLQGLINPIIFASKDVKKFGILQKQNLSIEQIFSVNWDLTIIYPRLSTSSNQRLKSTLIKITAEMTRLFSIERYKGFIRDWLKRAAVSLCNFIC